MNTKPISVVMLGASGAVGGYALQTLLNQKNIEKITLLGRTPIPNLNSVDISLEQHKIDIFEMSSYISFLPMHTVANLHTGGGRTFKSKQRRICKN